MTGLRRMTLGISMQCIVVWILLPGSTIAFLRSTAIHSTLLIQLPTIPTTVAHPTVVNGRSPQKLQSPSTALGDGQSPEIRTTLHVASYPNDGDFSPIENAMQQEQQQGQLQKQKQPTKSRWRRRLNRLGFRRTIQDNKDIQNTVSIDQQIMPPTTSKSKSALQRYNITTMSDLDDYWEDDAKRFRDPKTGDINYDKLLTSVYVEGNTQIIGSKDHPDYTHPVSKLLLERKLQGSTSHNRTDSCNVVLAVEGGGMRGCVSAGMVCALDYLGLRDCFDSVYGSSAGSMIGAYFINKQVPWFGPEVYYDKLTTAGSEFIDTKRLLRSLGFGLVDPRLFKDVLTRRSNGKPVLNLKFLLQRTMQETKPLVWDRFLERQKELPLRVVTSGLKSEQAVILDLENGGWNSLEELASAMHGSCLLPGIAGPVQNLDRDAQNKRMGANHNKKYVIGNNLKGANYEPLGDALIYEPLPYRTAVKEGATHVVVLRTRPDGTDTTGKGSLFERLITKRFFLRKNRLKAVHERMRKQLHKKLYAEDILKLNEAAYSQRNYRDTSQPHLLAVALPPGSPEVSKLETSREAIFEGVRRGFARAYDALVDDPNERGRGAIVAKECFPDEILQYDPDDIETVEESAFEYYLRNKNAKVDTST